MLPLGARQAPAAARCASAPGPCWASHEARFAQAPQTRPEQCKASAQEVGLAVAACEPCVSSGTDQTTVQQKVSGTCVF